MEIDWKFVAESLFRWGHIVAGILWIGMLYFFNFVNGPFAGKMDGDTKKKVVPELMPRALYWFRWGAAWTWITGLVLLTLVFYHGQILVGADVRDKWSPMVIGGIAIVFVAPFIYDVLAKTVFKTNQIAFFAGLILASGVVLGLHYGSRFEFRAAAIHLGAMFGTIMAYNVWFRIWPNQQKIIKAVKDGQPPDAALVAVAGTRSRHNTYMSVPLVFTMIGQHATWAASCPYVLPTVVLLSWLVVFLLYKKAAKVGGF